MKGDVIKKRSSGKDGRDQERLVTVDFLKKSIQICKTTFDIMDNGGKKFNFSDFEDVNFADIDYRQKEKDFKWKNKFVIRANGK